MYQAAVLAVVCFLTNFVSSDPYYRLNTPIVPSIYQIQIRPFFDTGDNRQFTFDGTVIITFRTIVATNQIKLHSDDLIYTANNITVTGNGESIPLDGWTPMLVNTKYSFVYINLQKSLQVGEQYELKIVYEGPIRDDLWGFFRNYYIENGVKKWLGATHMDARKIFPCFDEPELKAVFQLIIDRPSHYQPSLTNTKLQDTIPLPNNYVREIFYPTPKMSTYLLAFLISEFESDHYTNPNNNREFGIVTRPEAINQTKYAMDFGKRVVDALSEYFGIEYYSTNNYLKLDHVALINFDSGAMENWGIVKYREALLLYVPEESTPLYKYRAAQIIAHETVHMWFGNLVTCHWWSNTWLNEGFANYFQDYITALIEPEVYSSNMLVIGSVYAALDADELPSAPPMTNNNVFSREDILNHFGTITYQKAGSVIRMMHHLLEDAAFKYGLNVYLTENSFKAGYPHLLYTALEQGANATRALAAYNGARVADVMGSWVTQAGHPVLEIEVDYDTNTVSLSQRRFYSNGSYSSEELYHIPVTYTTGVFPNFGNTKPMFIMRDRKHFFTVPEKISENHSWIIFNVQETGLYRVKYDSHTLQIILKALKSTDRTKIHYLNRAKIVNDMFAFYFADEISFDVLHDTLEFLTEETDYNVWYAAIKGLNKLRNMYMGTDATTHIEAYILKQLENIIASLGYEEKTVDNYETLRNRMQILDLACKLGHAACLENAASNFRKLVQNGVAISPSLRPISYCAGLRLGTGADYDFMWMRLRNTNVANEARTISENLGCSTDENSLNKLLVSTLEENSPIMRQDLTLPLSVVLSNYSHVSVVINSLDKNLNVWKSIYPSMNTVYMAIAGALRTETEFEMFQNWLTSCKECGDVSLGLMSISNSRATAHWVATHKADLLSVLAPQRENSAPAVVSSLTSIAICLVGRMMR